MYCGPYSAGVLHSVSDQIRNLQNCFTAPNKMTSEDDIKGLVSLTSFVHGPHATAPLNYSVINKIRRFLTGQDADIS